MRERATGRKFVGRCSSLAASPVGVVAARPAWPAHRVRVILNSIEAEWRRQFVLRLEARARMPRKKGKDHERIAGKIEEKGEQHASSNNDNHITNTRTN